MTINSGVVIIAVRIGCRVTSVVVVLSVVQSIKTSHQKNIISLVEVSVTKHYFFYLNKKWNLDCWKTLESRVYKNIILEQKVYLRAFYKCILFVKHINQNRRLLSNQAFLTYMTTNIKYQTMQLPLTSLNIV